MKIWILFIANFLPLIFSKKKGQNITEEGEVSVTKNSIDAPLFDIVWCGKDYNPYEDDSVDSPPPAKLPKTIFILTHAGSLYLSQNDGEDWNSVNSILQTLVTNVTATNFSLLRIISTKSSPNKLIIQTNTQLAFFTNDCGKNFSFYQTNFSTFDLKHSNSNTNWILAFEKIKCEDDKACPNVFNLHLTKNSGQTWKLLSEGIFDAAWANLEKKNSYYSAPEERIIFTKYELVQKGTEQDVKTYVGYTDNFFTFESRVSEFGYKFYLTKHYLFILDSKKIENRDFELRISQTYENSYNLRKIKIPVDRIKDFSFTILDAEMGIIFLNINHNGDESRFGNVYVSDNFGSSYSLSLINNVRDKSGFSDFEKIHSMEGTYIANVFSTEKAERVKLLLQTSSSTESSNLAMKDLDTAIQTMMSFDRGSTWHYLKAPTKDSNGVAIKCVGSCSLHLRGLTDTSNNPIYSSKSAVGIIMGVGNVGTHLSEKQNEVNTYFSRNGGLNWFEVKKGSHIYEIGDHGALIVIAEDTGPTNKIHFTWDEGLTWTEIQISDEPFDITNIIIEPSNMAQRFIVYGEEEEDGNSVGILITLDFESLHTRVCSGIWEPSSSKSDYEIWVPESYKGNKCVMGKKVKYIRRKRDALCFNGEEKDRNSLVDFCACTEEDWECDFEFFRDSKTNECVPDSEAAKKKVKSTPPVNCNGLYNAPTGYRKIPGDFCVGGIDMTVKQIPCPGQGNTDINIPKSDSPPNNEPIMKKPVQIDNSQTVIKSEVDHTAKPIIVREINTKIPSKGSKETEEFVSEKPTSVKIFNYLALGLLLLVIWKFWDEIRNVLEGIISKFFDRSSNSHSPNSMALKEYERVQISNEDEEE